MARQWARENLPAGRLDEANKQIELISRQLKQVMFEGADAILAIRARVLSGEWEGLATLARAA